MKITKIGHIFAEVASQIESRICKIFKFNLSGVMPEVKEKSDIDYSTNSFIIKEDK